MARKKSNRVSLEQHKKAFRQNQAAIAKALAQNAELEKAITEEENNEIIGIIRHYRIGIDNLEQIMQGIRPSGESLFSEEKDKVPPVSPAPPDESQEKKEKKKSGQVLSPIMETEPKQEGMENEEE